jgi:hypothetical protein
MGHADSAAGKEVAPLVLPGIGGSPGLSVRSNSDSTSTSRPRRQLDVTLVIAALVGYASDVPVIM